MGCFFETAKKRIHCANNNNNNHNISKNKQQLKTSSSTTKATTSTSTHCDDSIIYRNKDNNQQTPNKTHKNTTKGTVQAAVDEQKLAAGEGGKNKEKQVIEQNKQQAVKALLRQQQVVNTSRKQQGQILKITTAKDTEAAAATETLPTLKHKIIDTKNLQNTATSYCLFPCHERQATNTQSNTNNNTISNCCHSSGSSWRQTLYSQQKLPQAQHYDTGASYTQVARNMAAAMAAACSGSSNTLPEMLLYARDHLAAYLTHASHCFMENLSNYAAAATATTTINAAFPLIKKQRQQQQQQRRHCWHRQQQQQKQEKPKCSHCQQRNFETLRQHQQQPQHYKSNNNNNNNNHSNEYCDHSCSNCSFDYSHYNISNNNSNYNNSNYNNNYYNTLRNSLNFYAASSVILVLCYLTTTTSAAATNSNTASIDKHPIQGIDWSKFDESSSDKEILDLLLEKKRYDKRLLPPVNGTLTVNVSVLLLSLASPDESSLKYEVEFLLNQQWNDPRLQYGNKSQYDYLNALHHHDNIWTPDTYFIMHGDFKDPIIPMHFALRIYRNGTITYAMRRHLILSCQGSLHIFPFDDPKCSFSMESISYEEAQIKYVWKNDEATLRKSPSLTTLNAYLIKNQTTACDLNSWRGNYSCLRVDLIFTRDRAFYFTTVFIPGIILVTSSFITFWLEWNAVPARSMIGNYSCLQVELTFTRDRAYYFTTVFIPGIILVTSSFITFWLEWNAVPARVMIGVTTMLNFFTTSNGFRSTLPVVSNLTAMNVWDGVCMCFIYASLLEFVCVNYVGRKRPLHNVVYRPGENPVTQRLPAVLSRIGVILASPLEIIEREFHAALSSEKAAAGISSVGSSAPNTTAATPAMRPTTPAPTATTAAPTMEPAVQQHGSIIGEAVQNLRARSVKYRKSQSKDVAEPIYMEPIFVEPTTAPKAATNAGPQPTTVSTKDGNLPEGTQLRRSHSMSTNTPPLVLRDEKTRVEVNIEDDDAKLADDGKTFDIDGAERQLPVKPPRKKPSRSTSPVGVYFMEITADKRQRNGEGRLVGGDENGDKRREASGPNEIVACTSCGGGNSPCTHSANNGCATETCFVQVRKKEPPHPIRVAKTIDVIARITFPTAYSIFLIFFFVHYKGFS